MQIQVISFRYLQEFRAWLATHSERDIIDIKTTGGFENMMIVVTYRPKEIESEMPGRIKHEE